jgi:hypothetical protein
MVIILETAMIRSCNRVMCYHHFNHALGSFLIAAAVGLGITVGIEYRGLRARHLDLNDSLISQRITMQGVRNAPRRY